VKAKRAQVGDVFEVSTSSGKAYIQVTHIDDDEIELVRVLPGIFPVRPSNLEEIVAARELYFTFYLLAISLKKKWVELIGNFPVPANAQRWPVMRHAGYIDAKGKVHGWHIGDASVPLTLEGYSKLQFVHELTPDQTKLSIHQIWNHAALVENLARGWTPERDEELAAKARARQEAGVPRGSLKSKSEYIDHYFYFPRKSDAQKAAARLRSKGWFAELSHADEDEDWLVICKQPAPISVNFEEIREELEKLAEELHGQYDGWGAAI